MQCQHKTGTGIDRRVRKRNERIEMMRNNGTAKEPGKVRGRKALINLVPFFSHQ